MKNYLTILLFFISSLSFSQDIIIINKKDSVNCTIKKIEKNKVTIIVGSKENKRKIIIDSSMISGFKFNFYKTTKPLKYKDFYFSLNVGYSHILNKNFAKTDLGKIYSNYLQKLRNGYNFNAFIHFYNNEHLGIGIKYEFGYFHNSINSFCLTIDSISLTYKLQDDIYLNFIAPTIFYKPYENEKFNIYTNVSVGYSNLVNNTSYAFNSKVKCHNIAAEAALGCYYKISSKLSLSFQVGYLLNNFNEFKYTIDYNNYKISTDINEFNDFSTFSTSIGFIFCL
ncbi:MAG: hypothetical protein WC223_00175 [Bacteroidales bacterium]